MATNWNWRAFLNLCCYSTLPIFTSTVSTPECVVTGTKEGLSDRYEMTGPMERLIEVEENMWIIVAVNSNPKFFQLQFFVQCLQNSRKLIIQS